MRYVRLAGLGRRHSPRHLERPKGLGHRKVAFGFTPSNGVDGSGMVELFFCSLGGEIGKCGYIDFHISLRPRNVLFWVRSVGATYPKEGTMASYLEDDLLVVASYK